MSDFKEVVGAGAFLDPPLNIAQAAQATITQPTSPLRAIEAPKQNTQNKRVQKLGYSPLQPSATAPKRAYLASFFD